MASLEQPCSCCLPYEPPGKVSRVEPKTFFANERTFLSWLNMSVTLGSIASALAAFGKSDRKQAAALQIMATVLVVTAISFCLYAMNTFFWRRRKIRRKEDGNFDDLYGPMTLSTVLLISLATIFASSVIKLAENDTVKAMVQGM